MKRISEYKFRSTTNIQNKDNIANHVNRGVISEAGVVDKDKSLTLQGGL